MLHEVVGNVHLHSICSDGSGTHEEIAAAASEAGLDFVIPTDHNVLVKGQEGWRNGVLMLIGEETNDPEPPRASHYVSFGISEDVAGLAGDPQALINEVRRQGGLGFIAHPCERPGPFVGEKTYDWTHWNVTGYSGISIWNYMSEFKSYLTNLPATLLAVFWPRAFIRGPFPETLALYDRLSNDRVPLPLIGTSDAHATVYSAGPLKVQVFPYVYLFRAVNLHLLLEHPLGGGDLDRDRQQIYGAMAAGRGFVGYHVLGDPSGFSFVASDGDGGSATFGEELALSGEVTLEIRSPRRARLRLLRNGELVAEERGVRLRYRTDQAGVYRVEAHRWDWFRYRGWVFTNPIYVNR